MRTGSRSLRAILALLLLAWLCITPTHAQRFGGGVRAPPVHEGYGPRDIPGRPEPKGSGNQPPRAIPTTPLDHARNAYEANPDSFSQSEPFRQDLPYLQVRTQGGGRYDSYLRAEAERKFRPALNAPFSVRGLSILAADMSDRPQVRAQADRFLRRHIPKRYRRPSAALSALLGAGRQPTVAEIRAMLRAHRNGTLVIIGHVEMGSGDFTITRGDHVLRLDLRLWSRIAAQERVNLIAMGCYSAAFSPLGAATILNSAVVIERLSEVIRNPPTTYAEFYGGLTSAELTLTLDLFNHEFYVPAEIRRVGQRRLGMVWWSSPEVAGGSPPLSASGPAAGCESSTTSEADFNTCVASRGAAAGEPRPDAPADQAGRTIAFGEALIGAALASLFYGFARSKAADADDPSAETSFLGWLPFARDAALLALPIQAVLCLALIARIEFIPRLVALAVPASLVLFLILLLATLGTARRAAARAVAGAGFALQAVSLLPLLAAA